MAVTVTGMAADYLDVVTVGSETRLRVIKSLRGVTDLVGVLRETDGSSTRDSAFKVTVAGRTDAPEFPTDGRVARMTTPGGLTALTWPEKDPDDVIDYGFEVGGFSSTDAINASEVRVEGGNVFIVSHDQVPGTQQTVTRLSGGDVGTAKLLVRTHMTSGQQVDQSINMRIAAR